MKTELSAKAFVIHDETGRIVSVGRTPAHSRVRIQVKPAVRGHAVLEADLSPEQAALTVAELHKRYRVDVNTGKLIRH